VNVVTTDGPAGRAGVTVSAMSSVSADGDRPIILVCVNKQSASAEPILKNGVFCVNILRDDQAFISDRFAGRHKGAEKFDCAQWVTEKTGAPRVVDPLVAFDCRLVDSHEMGTHYIFYGAVESIFSDRSGAPLIYANRAYGTPLRLRPNTTNGAAPASELKLGAFHTIGPHFVPEILGHLVATKRPIDLRIVEGDQRLIREGLSDGAIEIALIYDWDLGPDVAKTRLAAFKPYVALAASHPLALKPSLSLAELAAEPLILLDAPPSGDFFLSLFRDRGLEPNVRYRTGSLEMVRGMVGQGLGYSLLVTRPASDITHDGHILKTIDIADPLEERFMVLAYRKDRPLSKSGEEFIRACGEIFGNGKAA
jgi:flavin reductase (DIM6/NTAB) family NADH-FMN oxidoreductase RutF